MSSIDNRIVKMQFDNEQFERGVSKSMSTLDKLEEKLQFKKSSSGLASLQNSINGIDFGRFASAIEGINDKLSATGVMAATVVSRITNSLIDGAMKLENATIGQIKSGGWNRAMNIENAKFSIEGLKEDWTELYKAMDYAVTGTAYGIDQAATAAASLVASGVGYTEVIDKVGDTNVTAMHKALRAISGVAAQTNSDFDSISRIFTTVAGQGRLMGDQLNQLAARGMNAAAKLAETLGVTEAEVRKAVSEGAIDFETFAFAMDDAFGEHATDANKTFTGSLSNMKAALSRFGAVFATPVIQKTNQFFIALTDRIKEMKNAISDVTANGEVLEEHLESHFAQMWQELIDLADALVHKIDLTWFRNIADAADNAVVKIRDLLSILNDVFNKEAETLEGTGEKAYNLAVITAEELELAQNVIKGTYGEGQKRVKALGDAASALGLDPVKIQQYVNVVAKYGYSFEKAGIKITELTDAEEELTDAEKREQKELRNFTIAFHNFGIAAQNVRDIFSIFSDMVSEASMDNFGSSVNIVAFSLRTLSVDAATTTRSILNNIYSLEPLAETIAAFKLTIANIIQFVRIFAEDISSVISDTIKWWANSGELAETLENVRLIVGTISVAIHNIGVSIRRLVKSVLTALLRVLSPSRLTGVLLDFSEGLYGLTEKFELTEEGAEKLTDIFESIFTVIQSVAVAIGEFVSNILLFLSGIQRTDKATSKSSGLLASFADGFTFATTSASKLIDKLASIPDFLTKLADALRENEGVQRLKTAVTDLWTAMNESVKFGIKPFQEAVGEIEGEDPSSVTIAHIAETVGWFADKIAIVLEKIPTFVQKVTEFFETVKTKAKEAYDWVDSKIDLDGIKEKVEGLFNEEEGKTLGDKIKEFVKGLMDKLTEVLEKTDWDKAGTNSITLGVLAVLWELVTLGENANTIATSIAGIPKAISGIFKSFKNMFNSAATFTKNVGIAALIASIAAAILAIASAIVLLKEVDAEDFKRVADMMVNITGYIAILMLAVSKIVKHWASVQLQRNDVKVLALDIAKTVASFVSMAIDYISMAAAIWLIIKAITAIYEAVMSAGFDPITFLEAIGAVVAIMAVFTIATTILVKSSGKIFKKLQKAGMGVNQSIIAAKSLGILLVGLGAIMISIGVAVYLLSEAIIELSNKDVNPFIVIGVLAGVVALMFGVTQMIKNLTGSLRGLKIGDVLGTAALIFILTLGIVGIMGAVLGMSIIATGASFIGKEDILEVIFAEVIALVLALGYTMGKLLSSTGTLRSVDASAIWAVVVMLALMNSLVVATGYAVTLMLKSLSESGLDETALTKSIGPIIAVIAGVLGGMAALISTTAKSNLDDKSLFALATLMASIGVMMALFGVAFAVISDALSGMNGATLFVTFVIMIAMLAISIAGLIGVLEVAKKLGTAAPDVILSVAAAMAAMGITLLAMAAAFWIISTIKWDGTLVKVALGMMIGMVAILGFLGSIAGKNSGDANFATNMILAATAVVIMSASLLVFAAACYVLQSIDPMVILQVAGVLGALMIGLGLIGYVLGNIGDNAVNVLKMFAIAALSLGATIVVAAIGVMLMASALKQLSVVLPIFTIALGQFFALIKQNWVIALVALVAFAGVLVLIGYTIKQLAPVLNSLLQTASVIFGNLMSKLGAAANKVGTFVGNAITSLHKNATPKVKMLVVGLIGSLLSALTESGPEVLQTIGKFLIMIMDWLSEAVGPLADKLLDLLINLLEGLRKAIQSHSNQIWAAIQNIIYMLLDLVVGGVNQILRAIISPFAGGDWYDSHIGKTVAEVQEGIRLMADDNMAAAKAMDAMANGSGEEFREWAENIAGVTDAMAEQKKEAKRSKTQSYLDGIQDKIDSAIPKDLTNLKEQFADTFDIDTTKFDIDAIQMDTSSMPSAQIEDMIAKGMGDFDENGDFYKFTKVAKTDVAGAEDAYAGFDFPDDIGGGGSWGFDETSIAEIAGEAGYSGGTTYTTATAAGIADEQEEIVDATNSNVDAQINVVNDRYEDLKQAGRDTTKTMAAGVDDEYFTMYKSGGNVVDGLSKRISTFASATRTATGSGRYYGYESASAIKEGWDEGIADWPAVLREQFANAYYAADDGFCGPRALNINSPSKTTRYWGQMIIAGLTGGIEDNQESAAMSMQDLSNAMIISFGNPLEYAAKIASGEIQYDPSIRPVLDTTNIAAGAYGINSMFDNQNVAISGFSGKLATDISGLDTTNSQMVNELRSLRTDMNNMTEQITNMQIVMDGGQLVGAIAPTMDSALGRRAIYRGRGN